MDASTCKGDTEEWELEKQALLTVLLFVVLTVVVITTVKQYSTL